MFVFFQFVGLLRRFDFRNLYGGINIKGVYADEF